MNANTSIVRMETNPSQDKIKKVVFSNGQSFEEAKEEQEKTVTITENKTTEIAPDTGKTLSKVTVITNVEGSDGKLFAYSTEIPDPGSLEFKNALMYSFTEITESGNYDFYQPRATTAGDYYFLIEKYTVSVTSVDSDGNITDSDDMTYDRVADKDITL